MIDTKTFALAGNATFTVQSQRTGTRYTYKVRKSKDGMRHYVSLLTGPNNETNFQFFATIFAGMTLRHGNPDKTVITQQAPAAIAFAWLWKHIDSLKPEQVSIHHEGRCCRCGRTLTVPESIESGIGPECASKM